MIKSALIFLSGLLAGTWSHAATLDSYFQNTSITDSSAYSSNLSLREDRRVGVGTQIGGSAGLIGVHLELNVENQDGVLTGFGFGDGFSTFTIAWKHSFEGLYFTPYTTLGWSRWFSSSGQGGPDSYMLNATLSREERSSGQFGIDYIVGSVGAQYNQLDGQFAGSSLFAGVDLFFAPAKGRLMPSAAVGTTYFF